MTTLSEAWPEICQTMRQRIGDTAFEAWLKPIKARVEETTRTLVLEVPSDFHKDWIAQHYELAIRDLLKNSSTVKNLDYLINPGLAPAAPSGPAARSSAAAPASAAAAARDEVILNPKYTFEGFVVGPSNRFTHAACVSIADSPAKAYNPLFIYGKVGLGKTHLMQAICHRMRSVQPGLRFYYTTSERFTNDLINAIRDRSTKAFREKFRNVDVLLIDDIHFIAGKEATQEEFFHTFNALYDSHKQIIVSSDRPPKEIQRLEERLASRFGWGLVADIQPPDLETRVAILKKKIESESVDFPDEALHFIAETIKTNIRELEGALVRVIAYSLLEEKAVTLDSVKAVLKDLLVESARQVSLEDVLRVVGGYYHIPATDLKSRRRVKNLVLPRQVAMYLARELTQLSLPEIGMGFGGKDHTTVLYAVNKIKREIKVNQALHDDVDKILAFFKGG